MLLWLNQLNAEESTKNNDFKFSIKSYLHYVAHNQDGEIKDNRFEISRAYFTIEKNMNDFLGFRMTFDCYDDDDGVENRLKYAYAKFKLPDYFIFTKPKIEFGIAHTPWLDFEEHINTTRMIGKMFVEKNKTFNSADLGGTFFTLIGGEIDKEYQETVSHAYPGRYGSLAFGVYNGGGYHDLESNFNKVFQLRATARPLPDIIPGLQFSYLMVRGEGDHNEDYELNPMYEVNIAMLSYECQYLTATAQYLDGRGNNVGTKVDDKGFAQPYDGYSFHTEIRLTEKWKLIGQYDKFNNEVNTESEKPALDYAGERIVGGVGYDFGGHNILMVDAEHVMPERDGSKHKDETIFKLTMQVNLK